MLPEFQNFNPDQCSDQIKLLINQQKKIIEQLAGQDINTITWHNSLEILEDKYDELNSVFSPLRHLSNVCGTDKIRATYEANLALITKFYLGLEQNMGLYKIYNYLYNNKTKFKLNRSQIKILANSIRDAKLAGIELAKTAQDKFKNLSEKLITLTNKYDNNVTDCIDDYKYKINSKQRNLLSGLPEDIILLAQQKAEHANYPGYILGIDPPSYTAILSFADDAKLREAIYQAGVTKASGAGTHNKKFDNTEIMYKILCGRYEQARLLGFNNYAEYSLETKMAKSPREVTDFLLAIANKTQPYAKKEYTKLLNFAKKTANIDNLNPWDIAYYSELQKKSLFDFNEEELRKFFPLPKVLTGFFKILNKLYDLDIIEKTIPEIWEENVKFFEIHKNNKLIAKFYLDLFARPKKRGGAWMDECLSRKYLNNKKLQVPVAYINANFMPPVDNKPALLTHYEVITIFHEMGHGLHHMLTEEDYPSIAGIMGVPWDAVELSSQLHEFWCWEEEALKFISEDYKTTEPLPRNILKKLLAAKNYQAGLRILRQLEFSVFDIKLHEEFDPNQGTKQIQDILNKVRAQVSVIPYVDYNKFQNSFTHIFNSIYGGYAAGYYSYLWAEALAADAFYKFKEEGIFNKATSDKFLTSILAKGGSQDPEEMFFEFRGRNVDIDFLLKDKDII